MTGESEEFRGRPVIGFLVYLHDVKSTHTKFTFQTHGNFRIEASAHSVHLIETSVQKLRIKSQPFTVRTTARVKSPSKYGPHAREFRVTY